MNIAERAQEIADESKSAPTPHLEEMADLTLQMLRDALDAFVNSETARAELVRSADDAVDELYARSLRETTDFIAKHPDRALDGVRVIRVAKYLERIADHATNIAEAVIFMAWVRTFATAPTSSIRVTRRAQRPSASSSSSYSSHR